MYIFSIKMCIFNIKINFSQFSIMVLSMPNISNSLINQKCVILAVHSLKYKNTNKNFNKKRNETESANNYYLSET